jgi:hypothetical protein
VHHLASAAGGRQLFVNVILLAPCLFRFTGFIKDVGRVLGLDFILGLLVGLPLSLRHVANACDMHSSWPHSLPT